MKEPERERKAQLHVILSVPDRSSLLTILCGEQPRMKKHLPKMQQNITDGPGADFHQVHVKISSMDGQDEVARLKGIEARVLSSL
jgi:2C-methyl-D-erythritol 2,4-cyclodiphosphate synthase